MSSTENNEDTKLLQEANDIVKTSNAMEQHVINCPNVGNLNVFVQRPSEGTRSYNEVVIFTVHDLGCDHSMYQDFVSHPNMQRIRDRTVWVHVDVPGQTQDAQPLPDGYTFPTMQQLGESLIHVLDQLKIKEVVCFGEGAGANILARFAMQHVARVLGVVLIHCTGTTAGFMESIKDKVINWKLDHIGMNPTAESYLVLHRFGNFNKAEDKEQLKSAVESYQSNLRTKVNPKNLKKFVEAFLKRSSIAENIKKLTCPVLMITGQKSVFNGTTHNLHQALVKVCGDKGKVEFIEVAGVANVIEEKPAKLAESFQYFLQGLGLVSSLPMHHVERPPRVRTLSMEEYDKPLRQRSFSGGSGSPLSTSPPTTIPEPVPLDG